MCKISTLLFNGASSPYFFLNCDCLKLDVQFRNDPQEFVYLPQGRLSKQQEQHIQRFRHDFAEVLLLLHVHRRLERDCKI